LLNVIVQGVQLLNIVVQGVQLLNVIVRNVHMLSSQSHCLSNPVHKAQSLLWL
jgi:hypothetical protein